MDSINSIASHFEINNRYSEKPSKIVAIALVVLGTLGTLGSLRSLSLGAILKGSLGLAASITSLAAGIFLNKRVSSTAPRVHGSSLESNLEEHVLCPVDIKADCGFRDYLSPNEWNPEGIEEHLKMAEKGIIVSTGTERSFFDLVFCAAEKCEGLVVRDINPRVKAYVDFNTLLLRISDTREEYLRFTKPLKESEAFKGRIEEITKKMAQVSLPAKINQYYLAHLEDFAHIYLRVASSYCWKNGSEAEHFMKGRYDLDDGIFAKVQKYAREGNIVSTIGPINDLKFLKHQKISVVDTSNINSYSFIDLQGEGDFCPRVIRSVGTGRMSTGYQSHIYTPLTPGERLEFDAIMKRLKKCHGGDNFAVTISNILCNLSRDRDDKFDNHSSAICSPKTLAKLKEYTLASVLDVPGIGTIDLAYNQIEKLNGLTLPQITKLCAEKEIIPVLKTIIKQWFRLKPEIFLALSKAPGWAETVEKQFAVISHPGNTDTNVPYLKKLLGEHLPEFIKLFGEERFAKMEQNYAAAASTT